MGFFGGVVGFDGELGFVAERFGLPVGGRVVVVFAEVGGEDGEVDQVAESGVDGRFLGDFFVLAGEG